MDRFKSIFKREQGSGSPPQSPVHGNSGGSGAQANGVTTPNGQRNPADPGDAEGFLCPICMKSFTSPDVLQQHFDAAHSEPTPQVSVDKELELLKMQLTASEESRSLLSSELINMQRQMQELAMNKPDQPPDQTAEVKRLETQVELMQIENTELQEKNQLAQKETVNLQEGLNTAIQEQKTLSSRITSENEKYALISEQLTQEKRRNNALQEETRQTSEQLRKSEVSLEQQRLNAGRADEMMAKLSGKEELCRNLEQQINDFKQNSIKYDSEISQLKKSLDIKEESIAKSAVMHSEMKTAMESKIQSMESLIQEKTTSVDRILSENEQLQHKTQTLEGRLTASQSELTEANKKYDDLHQNFVQRIDAGEGTNVIVTQLKEDNARIHEKLKHTEERLQTEKEDGYQRLKTAEGIQKELEQKLSAVTTEKEKQMAKISTLETTLLNQQSEHEQSISAEASEHSSAISDLQSTISTQEEVILALGDEVSAKQESISSLTSDLQTANEQLSSLSTRLSDYEVKVTSLESDNTSLTQRLDEKVVELSTLTASNATLAQQIADQRAESDGLTSQLEERSQRLEQTTSETERLSATFQEQIREHELNISTLNEQLSSLQSDLQSSKDELEERSAALEQARSDAADLNRQMSALNESLSSSETERSVVLEQSRSDAEDKNRQMSALNERLSSSETERMGAQAENAALQSQVKDLELAKAELTREKTHLQGESNDSSSQLSIVSGELEKSKQTTLEREASILVLEQQIETQAREGESLQSSLLEQIDQLQSTAKQTDSAKQAEISKLNNSIDEMKAKIKKQSETNAALAKEHSSGIESLRAAESQLSTLQIACDGKQAELESLQQQLAKQSEDHSHVLQETTDILQRTSDENEVLNRALTELKTEISVTEEQLQNAQKNSDDWQSKHRLLQDDIDASRQALSQEKATSEETKQLLISHKLQMQSKQELLEEEKSKLEAELDVAIRAKDLLEERSADNLKTLEAALAIEKSKMEEAEAKSNMQLVSLTENLSLNKTDLTATQEKLMDVVKHNDELRGVNLELDTKLEASNDERNMLWNRCMASENETKALRDEKEELRLTIENLNSALHELGRENQSLQIKTTKDQSSRWVEDNEVQDCKNCAKAFNVRVRKHHCRKCGNIFCNECSSKQMMLTGSSKPSRVCDNCHVELSR